jgi:hypothetical protein
MIKSLQRTERVDETFSASDEKLKPLIRHKDRVKYLIIPNE